MDSQERYRVKPGFTLHRLESDRAVLLHENQSYSLSGELYVRVLSEIDKNCGDILSALTPEFSAAEIRYALGQLKRMGYVSQWAAKTRERDWWVSCDQGGGIGELFDTPVGIASRSARFLRVAQKALTDAGFTSVVPIDECKVALVLCDDYLDPRAAQWQDRAFHRGAVHCFPVKFSGRILWLGPLMKKGQRPCWRCLTEALRKNRPIENYLSENGGKPVLPVSPTSTVSMQFGISAAIIQLTKKLLHAADGDAELITLDMWNFSVGTHLIRTRPQCTACGDPLSYSRLPSNPVALNDVPRKFVENGGYRIVAPEKTWEKYKHLVSPLTGIVSHIDTYGKKNHQLRPVWKATFFVNPCRAHVDKNERFVKNSFGKGATAEQSRASALCEAIERYSFLYCGEEPRIRGTYNGLKPRGGIDPRALQHFSEKQYALRHEAAAPRSPQKIPRPFNPDLEISWTPVWSLTSHVWRYAPLQFCFSLTPTPDEENVCPFVSNGSAAGNCFEEALLQGILELVERDATAIWWYNRVVRPGIDVESFHDGYLNGVKTHYKEMGWDVWVLDVTHDLRLPAAVALAKNHATKHFAVGLGCHLSMHLAIQRAITEMHQTFDPADSHNPVWTEEEIENPAFLYPGDRPATKSGDWPLIPERSLKDDISDCAERIRKAGMELFVLNATRPDIGVCAVKAIVPGLRHFWKQLGPGRLSTVPVTLGWLDQELTEDEMNPKELAL